MNEFEKKQMFDGVRDVLHQRIDAMVDQVSEVFDVLSGDVLAADIVMTSMTTGEVMSVHKWGDGETQTFVLSDKGEDLLHQYHHHLYHDDGGIDLFGEN